MNYTTKLIRNQMEAIEDEITAGRLYYNREGEIDYACASKLCEMFIDAYTDWSIFVPSMKLKVVHKGDKYIYKKGRKSITLNVITATEADIDNWVSYFVSALKGLLTDYDSEFYWIG